MTVTDLLQSIETLAPKRWAMKADNIGLLVGDPACGISGIVFALDLTEEMIEFAISVGANVLVTHHPILWQPIRSVTRDTHEGKLILSLARANLNHVASHTNWDAAPGGINDTLAEIFGLQNVESFGSAEQTPGFDPQPYGRIGTLTTPITLREFVAFVDEKLDTQCMAYGHPDATVEHIAIVGGAADGEFTAAFEEGADVLVTGEVRHHISLQAGCIIAAGHFATENPGMKALMKGVQNIHPQTLCHFFEPQKGEAGRPL